MKIVKKLWQLYGEQRYSYTPGMRTSKQNNRVAYTYLNNTILELAENTGFGCYQVTSAGLNLTNGTLVERGHVLLLDMVPS